MTAEIAENGAFLHPCWKDGCDASAPFGYGVALRRDHLGAWACRDHRAELEAMLNRSSTLSLQDARIEQGKGADGDAHRSDAVSDIPE